MLPGNHSSVYETKSELEIYNSDYVYMNSYTCTRSYVISIKHVHNFRLDCIAGLYIFNGSNGNGSNHKTKFWDCKKINLM